MKRISAFLLMLLMVALPVISLVSCGNDAGDEDEVEFIDTPYKGTTLYVYNWGEYISDGSEGSLDVVKRFEQTYGITVKYDYFDSNETMYAQLRDAKYDIIIPSDYMIAKLAREDMLLPLDRSQISNWDLIDPAYRGQYYDPEDKYTVPYSVGMIGIVYNRKLIAEALGDGDENYEPPHTWDLLWNEKLEQGQIINFNNPRDAFGTALLKLGISLNTEDTHAWDDAYQALLKQKSNCIYLMDEVFNKMENGSAAVAAYYAGDCLTMMDVNPDLAFYYPEEGTNIFIDAMCIPKGSQNPGAAHLFIDFMLSPEVATANANYISYASPNMAVRDNEDYDYPEGTDGYEILYGTPDGYKTEYYHDLPDDTLQYMNDLWIRLSIEEEEGATNYGTIIFLALLALGVAWVLFHYGRKIYLHYKKGQE